MAAAAASGAISIPSSSASRITIVRVHDDNGGSALADGDAPLDGSPSSYGSSRPGRSNSWGSLHSASGSSTNVNTRSNSPGAARRPGGKRPLFLSLRDRVFLRYRPRSSYRIWRADEFPVLPHLVIARLVLAHDN